MPTSYRLPPPDTSEEFERLCLRVLRRHWSCPTLEIFGKRGEAQFGIDILDISGSDPVRAAQCKLKEVHKSLSVTEIDCEVEKARTFTPSIGHFAILTTAKISTKQQRRVLEINQQHRKMGTFSFELLAWDQINALLNAYPDLAEDSYGQITAPLARDLTNRLSSLFRSQVETLIGTSSDKEIEDAKSTLENHDYQTARFLVGRIRSSTSWAALPASQRASVLTILAVCHAAEDNTQKAFDFFMEAKREHEDEKTERNEALALLINDRKAEAHVLSARLRQKYPTSSKLAAIWINSAPRDVPVTELEAAIPAALLSDGEIAVSLARRLIASFSFSSAESYARSAVQSHKDWSAAWCVLGLSLLAPHTAKALTGIEGDASTLEEAIKSFTRSIECAKAEKSKAAEAEALLYRAEANELLGQTELEKKDLEDANQVTASNPSVLRQIAMFPQTPRGPFASDLLRQGSRNKDQTGLSPPTCKLSRTKRRSTRPPEGSRTLFRADERCRRIYRELRQPRLPAGSRMPHQESEDRRSARGCSCGSSNNRACAHTGTCSNYALEERT
jgi:tetratricopeptide (TPR) repeat protein